MKKYEEIFRDYKNAILNGTYKNGGKLPTEDEIARKYGTSRVPVQQALNALTSGNYVKRIVGAGTFVTYESNLQGRKNCKTVFLLSELNAETAQIMEGIQSILHERDIFVTTRFSYGNPDVEREVLEQLRAGEIEGLIMYESSSDANIDLIYELIISHAPLMLVDNLPNDIICNCVMSDPVQAMQLLVRHLYEKGHRRIAVVTHRPDKRSAADIRLKMLKAAMASFGLKLEPKYIKSGENNGQDIVELMSLPQPPTAIIFAAAVLATGCAGTFGQLKLRIPEDVSIVVHDDIERFSEMYGMKLTCVAQNYFEIGSGAARRLYEYMVKPDRRFRIDYIPVSFIEGGSVAEVGG